MVDFSEFLSEDDDNPTIEPRELYSQLSKRPGYGKLWDVQGQVLTAWHARRGDRDIVIKANTGGGKTIDGLLILQSYLNEGVGTALYVAPNKYLVDQVIREASNLGLNTTQSVDSSAYLTGEAIGIVNIHELVNGRSKFSAHRVGSRTPAPIGAVVVDDAHAALATTESQLSLKIPRENHVFNELFQLFADDLRRQSPEAFFDVEDGRRGDPAQIPFWAWRAQIDSVRKILRTETSDDGILFFAWPGVRDTLELSRAVFSSRELTITPYLPPIDTIASFMEAQHRVFLTATLADDSILVTHFAAGASAVSNPITPVTASDIGERMILVPTEINPDLELDEVRQHIHELSKTYNTVVIVPSEAWLSETWASMADEVVTKDNIQSVIDRLRSEHVGLVVLVNRYDGIDLPGDACRILVIDGLPEAFSPEERLRAFQSAGPGGIDHRQVQRIEQGMGRAVRSNEDHCVVFLLGPRLAQLTVDPRYTQMFSPATLAQLQLSRRISSQVSGQPLAKIMSTARQVLERDPSWIKLSLRTLSGIEPPPGHVSKECTAEREAFLQASHNSLAGAAETISQAARTCENDRVRGRLLEVQARYIHPVDPNLAQQILIEASTLNHDVLKPIQGATYTPLSSAGDQASCATERYRLGYSSSISLRLAFEAVLEDLIFDEFRTEAFEEAMRIAADLIGLGSQRPEHEIGSGPDNLWSMGNNVYWVIEAKTGAKSAAIGKRDVAQLGQSVAWFNERYDSTATGIPVIVHRSIQIYKDATKLPNMRVVTEATLEDLRQHLRDYSAGLAQSDWQDPAAVRRLLDGHHLTAEKLQRFTVAQRGIKS